MDYTTQSLSFKIKKALRYVRLYGIRRTLMKVNGQYHMKRAYSRMPPSDTNAPHPGSTGLLGCGNYAFSTIAFYLRKNFGCVIRAAMDKNITRAASLAEEYKLAWFTDDAETLIANPKIDRFFIASNHATHAEYAILALRRGKDVHIEKPHVVSEDQLIRLCRAMTESTGRVVSVGFNRPNSRIGREIRKHLATQEGAAMINWFVAGHELDPDHWYFNEEEGGRVLGNLCHWTDFTYCLVSPENRFPITIMPTRSEQSDSNVAVTYLFGDGTIAAITFSAKGHTFEGVRERFAAHRGNVLVSMDDFKTLVVEIVEKKRRVTNFYRDHGHENSIASSFRAMEKPQQEEPGLPVSYVWETGLLFLKTREALEKNKKITINAYNPMDFSL